MDFKNYFMNDSDRIGVSVTNGQGFYVHRYKKIERVVHDMFSVQSSTKRGLGLVSNCLYN